MSEQMIVRCNGIVISPEPEPMVEIEKTRKWVVNSMVNVLLPTTVALKLALSDPTTTLAQSAENAEKIRSGFQELIEVFTALAEPILWFYALTACILMVTKNKDAGWKKLQLVAYSYIGIALLPTFFSFLRWIGEMIKSSVTLG